MIVNTSQGPIDDSLLIKFKNVTTENDYRITTREYCVKGCPGDAHRRNEPDAPWVFCKFHIHRSVDAVMLKWSEGMGALAQGFGG